MYSNHFKEQSYLNFSLYYWLIISLRDLSWDGLFNRNSRKWLVFQPKICWNCQNAGDSLKYWYFYSEAFFILLLVYDFFWGSSLFVLMKLYNIRALLNCANCWNFQSDQRNLDMLVFIRSLWSRQTACSSTTFWLILLKPKRILTWHISLKMLFSCNFGVTSTTPWEKRFSKV